VGASDAFQITDMSYTVTFVTKSPNPHVLSPFGNQASFSGTYSQGTLTLLPLLGVADASGAVNVNWYVLTLGAVVPNAKNASFEFSIAGSATVAGNKLAFTHDPEVDIGMDEPVPEEASPVGAAASA